MKTTRESILNQVKASLDACGCEYAIYDGCFDIAARKRNNSFLIKVLLNVDSFQKDQARNLALIASIMNAKAFIIGKNTRRECLTKNIIYERFDIPTFSPETLDSILSKENIYISSSRGGLFSEIDPNKLRKSRLAEGLTQSELAEKVGITKKSIYEHETKPMKSNYTVAEKLERIVGDVTNPVSIEIKALKMHNEPSGKFEKYVYTGFRKKGFETDIVHKTPFNIVARSDEFILLSDAEEKLHTKKITYLHEFSRVSKKPAIVVTKTEVNSEIPTISEKDFKEMNKKDLKKIVKKW